MRAAAAPLADRVPRAGAFPRGAGAGADRPVLSVDGASVIIGGQLVLREVTMSVSPGQLVGLIGPNGAGKTTLIRAINSLIPLHAGSISTSGTVGYVPQISAMSWDYPVALEQVVATAFAGPRPWCRPTRDQWAAAYRALEAVGMLGMRRRTLAELSGGQKQRLLIARALATGPSLLLLDEPLTGLDHPHQDSLLSLFEELAGAGVAILMSTHDLTQAADVCTDLVLLNRTVHAQGPFRELTDPELWMTVFDVAPDSALLKSIGLVAR